MVKIAMRIAAGLVVLVGISFVGLTMSSGYATTSTATASITVAAACTMSSVIDTTHNTTISNGTYREDIGKTTLKVVCNDNSGFSIYAIGYSGDEYGNNKLLASIGGVLSPTNDIVTGTATSGNTSNWAMKITPIAGTYSPTISSDTNGSFANYHIVPDKYVKVATFNSTTDATIGSSIEATYRAYVSSTQPAGTYTGKVKYTMVHPASAIPNQPMDCDPNRICYWPNAEGSVVDSMGDQSVDSTATTTELWATNFRRDGYGFAGWSDKFDWVLNENDTNGNGTGPNEGHHIYGPNQTITTPSDMATKGLSLYAVWIPAQGNLQNWNGCSAMNIGEVTALKDARDHDAYTVAKLEDGKCWMAENLRLNNTAILTTANTNNPASGFALSASQDPNIIEWCNTDSASCINQSMLYTGNTTDPVANMTDGDANIYSYGNYYNWYSATAGRGTYDKSSGNAEGDICPVGWHLPTGSNSGEFATLFRAMGGDDPFWDDGVGRRWRSFPLNFVCAGVIGNGVNNPTAIDRVIERGDVGNYLSSTANPESLSSVYTLRFFSVSGSYPWNTNSKKAGRSVRCLVGS